MDSCPAACTCRRVSLVVHAPDGGFSGCADDVRWRVRGETTVKRLAAACVGVALWGADAWRKYKIPAVAFTAGGSRCVCSRCTVHPSLVPCVCVRELLLGVTAAGMMVPLTVGWVAVLTVFTPFSSCFYFPHKKERK
ncbi:chitin binding-like protein [Trypanosoma cruzi cruzi]|nr:chitin binding-like protein [Trypanosoma cruzi cruzi]